MTMTTPPPWRNELFAWATEVAEMCKSCRAYYPETKAGNERYGAFVRREFKAAWQIFAQRNRLSYYASICGPWSESPNAASYPYRVWRDAVAREMGWLHGRMGDAQAEWVRQRRLEAAGQQRLFA